MEEPGIKDTAGSSNCVAQAIEDLRRLLGKRLDSGLAVRAQHANVLTWAPNEPPDVVVYPESAFEVAEIVSICSKYRVPLIPYGTGTSLEGHVNAPMGGICVSTRRMNRIRQINAEDFDCVVEPGVTRLQLNSALRDLGLFFPVDPGADASLGGMVSTRASGTNAVRYGTMKDNVISLDVVLANGRTIKTASRARKSAAGYDLTRLFVGAEGTLGFITSITLKLHGLPEAIAGGVCSFPDVKSACDTAIVALQSGIPIARVEFMDESQVKACNLYSKLTLPETPVLFVEFHGTPAGVDEQRHRFVEIAREMGGNGFEWATNPEERSRIWHARHQAFFASMSLMPGSTNLATDVCVPISRLAECVSETKADIRESGMLATIVGHVGDGNFHVHPVFQSNNSAQVANVKAFLDRLVRRALDMGGTCTGEHGIGQEKIKFMALEHGEPTLDAMRAIKSALDPINIMNPGKMLPPV